MWTSGSGNNDVQFGKGAHKDLAIYDLDLTALGYDIKVEDGTWAETYDVLISEIKSCKDAAKRYDLMHVAEDMIMATGCITPIYYYTDVYMIDSSVEGFFSIPLGYKFFMYTTIKK
jgi:oligopeptide transport system substrate-binding protein